MARIRHSHPILTPPRRSSGKKMNIRKKKRNRPNYCISFSSRPQNCQLVSLSENSAGENAIVSWFWRAIKGNLSAQWCQISRPPVCFCFSSLLFLSVFLFILVCFYHFAGHYLFIQKGVWLRFNLNLALIWRFLFWGCACVCKRGWNSLCCFCHLFW